MRKIVLGFLLISSLSYATNCEGVAEELKNYKEVVDIRLKEFKKISNGAILDDNYHSKLHSSIGMEVIYAHHILINHFEEVTNDEDYKKDLHSCMRSTHIANKVLEELIQESK